MDPKFLEELDGLMAGCKEEIRELMDGALDSLAKLNETIKAETPLAVEERERTEALKEAVDTVFPAVTNWEQYDRKAWRFINGIAPKADAEQRQGLYVVFMAGVEAVAGPKPESPEGLREQMHVVSESEEE